MIASRHRRNVWVLAGCWTLFHICYALLFTTAPLIGYALAAEKALATLPLTMMMLGTVATTAPASLFMRRVGRRAGFVLGSLVGALGGAVALMGVWRADFALFCLGALLFGGFSAFAQYYRFAAADAAPTAFRSRAISLVLAAGVVAAFVGPELAKIGRTAFGPVEFFAGYAFLTVGALLSALLALAVAIPKPGAAELAGPRRPMRLIARQPAFIVAVSSATLSYVVMALIMIASPLAVRGVGHSFDAAAFVIQWHVVAMFAPGFVTGALIARYGVLQIVAAGLVLLLIAILVALSGTTLLAFWVSMVLLGIGWNFAFTGGTTLLTEVHTVAERAHVQAVNDFTIFGAVTLCALGSGATYHYFGWAWVNLMALPFVALAALATAWLALRRQRPVADTTP